MLEIFVGGSIFLSLILIYFYQIVSHKLPTQAMPTSSRRPVSGKDLNKHSEPPFRGFRLVRDSDCCQAARVLSQVTFFGRDHLPLPLSACDKPVCTCSRQTVTERRLAYRRSVSDRRTDIRFDTDKVVRRSGSGRRRGDQVWKGGYRY